MKLTEHIYLVGSACMGISPAGDCNVYAVADGTDIYLIDCGLETSGKAILENMNRDGLDIKNLRGVLLTHVHPDHAGAIGAFREMGIPIFGCAKSQNVLEQGIDRYYALTKCLPASGFRDYFCREIPGTLDHILQSGETLKIGSCTLEMIPAPGHSPDSVCYLLRDGEEKHLFTGDTLFYPGHINYFAPPLSCTEFYRDTLAALAAIHPDGLYPGHALCTVDRAWQCTDRVKNCLDVGVLPPLKPYS